MVAYVAQYDFTEGSWSTVGTMGTGSGAIPGPVTAIATASGDTERFYASGVSAQDGSPYLCHWDGQSWETKTPALDLGSQVSQMVLVPLTSEHKAKGSMENDRMLMVMGNLRVPDSGNATAALYDGDTWHPYLTSISPEGSGSAASGIFYSIHNFDFEVISECFEFQRPLVRQRLNGFSYSFTEYLALGLIVLIALAISTGLIFLFVLLGLAIMFCMRRFKKPAPRPIVTTLLEKRPSSEFDETDSIRLRRLGAIQEAVFGSAAVASTSFANASKGQSPKEDFNNDSRSSFGYESTNQGHAPVNLGSTVPADTSFGAVTSPSHMGRPTTVKYNFIAEDPAELSVNEGDEVNVLEEAEDEQWWYVRDKSGREGVVPASYLW